MTGAADLRRLLGSCCVLLVLALSGCAEEPVGASRAPEPRTGGAGGVDTVPAAGLGGTGIAPIAGSAGAAPGPLRAPNANAILMGRCAKVTVQSQLLPSNMLIVLDRSASMACNPPPLTDSPTCERETEREYAFLPNKWEITRDTLLDALGDLPPDTVIGLSYFSNDDSCGVHSLPSVPLAPFDARQSSALRASLSNVTPNGATPLVGATVLAYRHLHDKALAGEINGSKYVVLITDGEQSDICSDPGQCRDAEECTRLLLEEDVPRAASEGVGIKTFVIGVPGSEGARNVLSAIAQVGGTAPDSCEVSKGDCHFDMTQRERFGDGLRETLTEIAGRALSCELPLPDPGASGPLELERLNVIYSPADGSEP
ncbi:MAG TPA: VWA domain-containing protein, partial [Polyangiales bacterium]|nr:VWA domain-containing protein [Polyangiales bacterium]